LIVDAPAAPAALIADKYRITRLIGRGGMASVWQGVHTSLGINVAIKLLDGEHGYRPEALTRFENEARAAAAIRSKHCVEIYDHGVTAEGIPFIVMELLIGEPLDARLARGPFAPGEFVRILVQVCRALAKAHSLGIVHRDLKPENIFLVRSDDEFDVAKVVDFGIAKYVTSTGLSSATRTGAIMGTPHYMSPEQARGLKSVDYRSDLWSIGVIAFQCAVGQMPFAGEAVGDLLVKICTAPLPIPSHLASNLPKRFDSFIERALNRDPAARFSTATELAIELANAFGLSVIDGLDELPWSRVDEKAPKSQEPQNRTQPYGSRTSADTIQTRTAPASLFFEWEGVLAAIPSDLSAHTENIVRFLTALFERSISISDSAHFVRLSTPRFAPKATREFIAVFLGQGSTAARVQTATFLEYVNPLEQFLQGLDNGVRKVVIAIVDSLELGRGVRSKIFEFNREYSAIVLPFHVGDLASNLNEAAAIKLFQARLEDYHVFPDVFGPGHDSASLFGCRGPVNELISYLSAPRFVVVHGSPGGGKSSLVRAIRTDLPNARFVEVRCIVGPSSLAALVERIEKAIGVPFGDEAPSIARLKRQLEAAAESIENNGYHLILLLEDADWLIRTLLEVQNEELLALQAFWGMLEELTSSGKMSVIVTSIWGELLTARVLGGWQNPLSGVAKKLKMTPLGHADLANMMGDLGIQINVTFEAAAVDAVFSHSAGSVCVARVICRELTSAARRKSKSPLDELVVGADDVTTACAELAHDPATFHDRMLSCLTKDERGVLRIIAESSPRDVNSVVRTFGRPISLGSCNSALERLRSAEFFGWVDKRMQLSVPLFATWLRKHEPLPGQEARRKRTMRAMTIAFGVTVSLTLVALHVQLFGEQTIRWDVEDCAYTMTAPQRITPSRPKTLRTVRSCRDAKSASVIAIEPGEQTFVRFPGASPTNVGKRHTLGRDDPNWANDQFDVTFEDMNHDRFQLAVVGATRPSNIRIVIEKDWMGGIVANVLKIAAMLPALLAGFTAYSSEILKAFELFRLRKSAGSKPS
jgi:serine/threonine protein kinase